MTELSTLELATLAARCWQPNDKPGDAVVRAAELYDAANEWLEEGHEIVREPKPQTYEAGAKQIAQDVEKSLRGPHAAAPAP